MITPANLHIRKSAHPVFLIGFMGSGKTFWGRRWAERSGLKFFDIDEMVEEEQERSIAEIFEQDGEDFFRDLETDFLRGFAGKDNVLVACGGGTVCYNDNITWMNENGITMYLKSSPQKIVNRLKGEIHTRPMIKHLDESEIEFYITEKIKEREFFYNRAKIIIDVDELDENYIPEFLVS